MKATIVWVPNADASVVGQHLSVTVGDHVVTDVNFGKDVATFAVDNVDEGALVSVSLFCYTSYKRSDVVTATATAPTHTTPDAPTGLTITVDPGTPTQP